MACNTEECKDQGINIDPPSEPPHGDFSCSDLDSCPTIISMKSDIAGKQDQLTAGANITIENNVISATGGGGGGYVAGDHITITGNTISATFDNASQSSDGLMSAADKTKLDGLTVYTAGDNISITNGEISLDLTKADILEILGYDEIDITMTDINNNTVSITVLGVRNNG